jgi:hypothetical protein
VLGIPPELSASTRRRATWPAPKSCSRTPGPSASTSWAAPISTVAEPPTPLQLVRHFLRLGATTAGWGLTKFEERDAEVNFGAAAKPGGFKDFRMIETRNRPTTGCSYQPRCSDWGSVRKRWQPPSPQSSSLRRLRRTRISSSQFVVPQRNLVDKQKSNWSQSIVKFSGGRRPRTEIAASESRLARRHPADG